MEQIQLKAEGLDEVPSVAAYLAELSYQTPLMTFSGDLGSGKTTLIKNICKLLNVKEDVTSPTYALVNEYQNRDGEKIFHFDFYRLDQVEEAIDIGCEEYFNSGDRCLIEWPDLVSDLLPEKKVEVKIDVKGMQRTYNLSIFS